ncbi:hypothetical protein X801_02051, partial [Opisthorchis viverrini]
MASILTEHLGQFKNPVLFEELRGECDPTSLGKLTRLLAFGENQRSTSNTNSIVTLKQRLTNAVWTSISETLQSIPTEPWESKWFQKLAFIYQRLISASPNFGFRDTSTVGHSGDGTVPDKSHIEFSEQRDEYFLQNMRAHSDEERLRQLLQRGNIAFHGLAQLQTGLLFKVKCISCLELVAIFFQLVKLGLSVKSRLLLELTRFML